MLPLGGLVLAAIACPGAPARAQSQQQMLDRMDRMERELQTLQRQTFGGGGSARQPTSGNPYSAAPVPGGGGSGSGGSQEGMARLEVRMGELAAEAVEAARAGDAVGAALARAEREAIAASLAGEDEGDVFDRARRAVATRIRMSMDHLERVEPVVGSHLRASIRTGTFCSYRPDPDGPTWEL